MDKIPATRPPSRDMIRWIDAQSGSLSRRRALKLALAIPPRTSNATDRRWSEKWTSNRVLHDLGLYRPLAENDIRLLRLDHYDSDALHCTLEHFQKTELPMYVAVSYTWKDPARLDEAEHETVDIQVNDRALSIGSNLASALLQLAMWDVEYVWADAICINQWDKQERGHQVPRMKDIYMTAGWVLVWLGRATALTESTFDFLEHSAIALRSASDRAEALGSILDEAVEDVSPDECSPAEFTVAHGVAPGLARMVEMEYWSRAWIIQEIHSAFKITVAWGCRHISWTDFTAVFDLLRADHPSRSIRDVVDLMGDTAQRHLNTLSTLRRLRTFPSACGTGLLTVLGLTRGALQSDPRDSIYARLGITYDGQELIPEPTYEIDVAELFTDFVLSCIKAKKDLYVICMARSAPSSDTAWLPTWVPDWTKASGSACLCNVFTPEDTGVVFRAAGKSEPVVESDGKTLRCRGMVVDKIGRTNIDRGNLEAKDVVLSVCRTITANHAFRDSVTSAISLPPSAGRHFVHAAANYLYNRRAVVSGEVSIPIPFSTWLAKERRKEIFGRTLEAWTLDVIDEIEAEGVWVEDEIPPQTFFTSMSMMIAGRKMETGVNGSISLVPEETVEDDLVCILLGCPVPVVLRPSENGQHRLIGECYVDGIMHGQAMALLKGDSSRGMQDFDIQ